MILWPSNLNSRFYDMETTTEDNVIRTTFESGRESVFLKNRTARKQHSVKLDLTTSAEEQAFWSFYDNILLSGTQSIFMLSLLGTGEAKEYRITNIPTLADGDYPKTISLTFKEV